MKRVLLAVLVALGIGSVPAAAADMYGKALPGPAPLVPVPSGWSGWIVGAFVAGDWNDFKISGVNSQNPSSVSFGVTSDLIYMFNPYFGVGHKLLVRYSNPSVNLGIGLGSTDVPYWRGDSLAELVFAPNDQWAFTAGVGFAAQTLKFDVIGGGLRDPTYGWAADLGVKVKPIAGSNWVFGVDGLYENMDGLCLGPTCTQVNNFSILGSVAYHLHN